MVEFNIDSVRTSNLQGTVVAQDGLTIAVGGLISDTTNVRERKVPGLCKLPVIGKIFRQYIDENIKTELILLITPHVITTPVEGQYQSEARLRALSDHPQLMQREVSPQVDESLPDSNASVQHWNTNGQPYQQEIQQVQAIRPVNP